MLNRKDSLIATLAKDQGLVDESSLNQVLKLLITEETGGRGLEKILLDEGVIDRQGYNQLIQAFNAEVRRRRFEKSKKIDAAQLEAARAPAPTPESDAGDASGPVLTFTPRGATPEPAAPAEPEESGEESEPSSSGVSFTDIGLKPVDDEDIVPDESSPPATAADSASESEPGTSSAFGALALNDDSDELAAEQARQQLEKADRYAREDDDDADVPDPDPVVPAASTPSGGSPSSLADALESDFKLDLVDDDPGTAAQRHYEPAEEVVEEESEPDLEMPDDVSDLEVPDDDDDGGLDLPDDEDEDEPPPTAAPKKKKFKLGKGALTVKGNAPAADPAADDDDDDDEGGVDLAPDPEEKKGKKGSSVSQPIQMATGEPSSDDGGARPLTHQDLRNGLRDGAAFVGTKVGDYLVDGEVARGGMGVVLRALPQGLAEIMARERGFEGPICVKAMLPLKEKPDPAETERFSQEVKTLINLHHPHIVRIFDSGMENGLYYYSMELIHGVNARQLVTEAGKPPPLLLTLRIIKECASAFSAIHDRNVFHRDIKPTNVLIDKTTSPFRSVLIDFGLVKNVGGAGEKGLIVGTPSYMPPEQARPRKNYGEINATSDIYSLGATFFFLLTGRPPFEHRDPRKIIKMLCKQPPPDPCELVPGLPRNVADICLKCLEKKQKARYRSGAELIKDLEALEKKGQRTLKMRSFVDRLFRRRKR